MAHQSSYASLNSNGNRRPKRGSNARNTILIAIDLGTTYSSVAYMFIDGKNPGPLRSLRDQFRAIDILMDEWPGSGGDETHTVPTEILYADLPNRPDDRVWFGHEIEEAFENRDVPNTAQRIRLAKLLLHEAEETKLETESLRAYAATSKKDPLDFVKEYLRYLRKCIMHYFEKHHKGWLKNSDFEYIFGCPPAWSICEHQKMVEIAKEAGMRPTFMGSEAEALLAVHLAESGAQTLQTGDDVIVCDAGGGTVDLVTVTIQKLEPLEVIHACVSEGATCGGIYVDRRMEELLKRKLAPEKLAGFEEVMDNLMKKFVSTIKKRFGGTVVKERKPTIFEVRGLQDDAKRGFLHGRLYIPCEEMMSEVFDPSVNEIVRKVLKQIRMSRNPEKSMNIKRIVLGGGFGNSTYLNDCLRSASKKHGRGTETIDIEVLPKSGGANVASGLILLASNQTLIKQRRSRANYGLITYVTYDAKIHGSVEETEPEIIRHLGNEPVVELIYWFLAKGQAMTENFIIRRKEREIGVFPGDEAIQEELYVYEGDLPDNLIDTKYTLRKDLPDGFAVWHLEVNLQGINMDQNFLKKFSEQPGFEAAQPRYSITYDFTAKHKNLENDWITCSLSLKSKSGELIKTPPTRVRLPLQATKREDGEEVLLGSLVSRGEMGLHIPESDFDRPPLFPFRKRPRDEALVPSDEEVRAGTHGNTIRKYGKARRGRGGY